MSGASILFQVFSNLVLFKCSCSFSRRLNKVNSYGLFLPEYFHVFKRSWQHTSGWKWQTAHNNVLSRNNPRSILYCLWLPFSSELLTGYLCFAYSIATTSKTKQRKGHRRKQLRLVISNPWPVGLMWPSAADSEALPPPRTICLLLPLWLCPARCPYPALRMHPSLSNSQMSVLC